MNHIDFFLSQKLRSYKSALSHAGLIAAKARTSAELRQACTLARRRDTLLRSISVPEATATNRTIVSAFLRLIDADFVSLKEELSTATSPEQILQIVNRGQADFQRRWSFFSTFDGQAYRSSLENLRKLART